MKVILKKEHRELTPLEQIIIVMLGIIGLACALSFAPMLGKTVAESYDLPEPTMWTLKHHTEVYLDGDLTRIIGTDECPLVFGGSSRCWRFSLTPGDVQAIGYANGHFEEVTTRRRKGRGVYLERPDGTLIQVRVDHSRFQSIDG